VAGNQNTWQYRGQAPEIGSNYPDDVLAACDGSPLLARLLANRGIKEAADISAFLNLDQYQPTDPNELPDAQLAVDRIVKAIDAKEPILIYGDFDVDGITGTSVLYETLKKHLKANASYYIPDRATEGHGLHSAALVRLTSTRRIKLVITTDTGITNFSEVSLLNGLQVDTVITDHHALPENLPQAIANVNPQRLLIDNPEHPLGHMCGAGVAYKLCELLLNHFLEPKEAKAAADALLDIVAVGTVVDMVPLIRENRYLVYRGLQVLNLRQRKGFQELLAQAGAIPDNKTNLPPIDSETLGFTIGPRLNALGRLEKADQGVELITGDDPERLRVIAAHLEFLNRKRRDLCDQTFLEADSHLQRQGGLAENRCIILASPSWNPGIIGIVASRLIEKYHVPVFMMMIDEAKDIARCSARSIPGFNLHDQLLNLERYFLNFGGHAGAAGFSIKREHFETFKRDLYALCLKVVTDEQMRPIIPVDIKLEWSQINPHLLTLVNRVAPFGMENPSPRFVVEPLQIAAQRNIGEGERHLKLVLTPVKRSSSGPTLPMDGLMWNVGAGTRLDASEEYGFVVNPGLNNFNGVTKVQLIIEDYRVASASKSKGIESKKKDSALEESSSQPLNNSKTASMVSEKPQNTSEEGKEEGGIQWVDHRQRDELDEFIAQMMRPLESERSVIIYHEGRPPEIPFLNTQLLATRFNLKAADELILWDLPPSAEWLANIIATVKPRMIHIAGGKYRTVPLFQPEKNYLTLILQFLRREHAQKYQNSGEASGAILLNISEFASRLGTSDSVISHGLVLLEKMDHVKVLISPSPSLNLSDTRAKFSNSCYLNVTLSETARTEAFSLEQQLEYLLFQDALQKVLQYRGWLMKSPLDTIKRAFFQIDASSSPNQSLEGLYGSQSGITSSNGAFSGLPVLPSASSTSSPKLPASSLH